MEIEKLSASAMDVAELCLSRYAADLKAGRIGGFGNSFSQVGTACHDTMQTFVEKCVLTQELPYSWDTIEMLYMQAYIKTFANSNLNSKEYKDGFALMKKWFARTSFEGFKVLMVEQKLNFQVPVDQNPDGTWNYIPFNYIFDRLDQYSETEYRVMDYKTLSRPVSPGDLHQKLQARVYGLAAQIMFPHATRIWVGFDMLRWEGSVETAFSRDDNIETWNRILSAVQRIKATQPNEDGDLPETLNSTCGFCIKKTTCKAATANAKAGGPLALDLEGMINARALLKFQAGAAERAYEELDQHILAAIAAQEEGVISISTDLITATAKMRGIRSVNVLRVKQLVGEELFNKYGNEKITMKDFDALLADPQLPAGLQPQLENLITKEYGAPYLETREKGRK